MKSSHVGTRGKKTYPCTARRAPCRLATNSSPRLLLVIQRTFNVTIHGPPIKILQQARRRRLGLVVHALSPRRLKRGSAGVGILQCQLGRSGVAVAHVTSCTTAATAFFLGRKLDGPDARRAQLLCPELLPERRAVENIVLVVLLREDKNAWSFCKFSNSPRKTPTMLTSSRRARALRLRASVPGLAATMARWCSSSLALSSSSSTSASFFDSSIVTVLRLGPKKS